SFPTRRSSDLFQKGTGINTRRRMPLEIDQVGILLFITGAKKIVEPHVVQGSNRRERRKMPAQVIPGFVGTHHHGNSIPANQGADTPFHEQVAGHTGFLDRWNRVAVRGSDGIGKLSTFTGGTLRES